MLFLSDDFENAFEAEIDRLVQEKFAEFQETEEYFCLMDKKFMEEVVTNLVTSKREFGLLGIELGLRESEEVKYIDFIKLVEEKIELINGNGEDDDKDWLQEICDGLEVLIAKVRGAIQSK